MHFIILLNLFIFINASNLQSICYDKVEVIKNVKVTKTRTTSVPWYSKLSWPRKQKSITYEEIVPEKSLETVKKCCKGFFMHKIKNICLPYCEKACIPEARCIEPNVCKCRNGYKEIRDHSETEVIRCELLANVTNETTADSTEATEATETTTSEYSETTTIMDTFDDCKLSKCPENAKCLENGTCTFLLDNQLLTDILLETNFTQVTANDYSDSDSSSSEELMTLSVLCVGVVGSLVIVIALIAFVWLSRGRLCTFDKKAETNLTCEYHKRDEDANSLKHC